MSELRPLRANERADERVAQYNSRPFHIISTQRASLLVCQSSVCFRAGNLRRTRENDAVTLDLDLHVQIVLFDECDQVVEVHSADSATIH